MENTIKQCIKNRLNFIVNVNANAYVYNFNEQGNNNIRMYKIDLQTMLSGCDNEDVLISEITSLIFDDGSSFWAHII